MPTPARAQSPVSEPIVTTGWISALVTAVIGLLVAFGLPLTDEQQVAVLGLTAVVAPIIVALVGRRSVVEYASSGQVRAGAASELHTGDYVRRAGTLDPAQARRGQGDEPAG